MNSLYKMILLGQIRLKRIEMHSKANDYGLTDPRVVGCSQALDNLLNKYQELEQSSHMEKVNL